MTRKRKDYRELKVSSFSGYGYKSAPMLRIQGLWLEELGFNIGDILLKALVLSSISIDLIIRTISMEGQEHYIRQLRISKAMMSGR